MTVRSLPRKRTRTPLLLGCSPSPATMIPAATSSSLNAVMSVRSCSLGIVPASELLVALTITITRIVFSFVSDDLWLVLGADCFVPLLDERLDRLVRGADLERAETDTRMLRHQRDGVIQIAGLEDEDTAEVLLRFRVWAVGDVDALRAVAESHGGLCFLQRLAP